MGKKVSIPPEEEIRQKYIADNLQKDEAARIFGVSVSTFSRWLSLYNIKKETSLIQQNVKRSILDKYGSPEALAAQALEQRKKTCLERYGVDNVSKNEKTVEKIKQSLCETYPMPDKDDFCRYYITENHSKEECAKKYGVHSSTISKWVKKFGIVKNPQLIKEGREKTNLEKYGAKSPLLSEDIKRRSLEVIRSRYGVDNVFSSEEIKQKIVETNIKKYGFSSPMKNPEFKKKMFDVLKEKHGVEYAGQVHADPKAVEILSSKESLASFITENYKEEKPSIVEIGRDLHCSETAVGHKINAWGLQDMIGHKIFLPEQEIKNFLNSSGLEYSEHNREILGGKEIDFYIPQRKIGIEFNGSYWHSEAKKNSDYHQRKSLLALEKGVFIFHIFEYEWEDPEKKQRILNRLSDLLEGSRMEKIYARKTFLKEVPKEEKNHFLEENHLQGSDHSSICLGLYDNGSLVSLMSFCKPRFAKNADWEISRYCSKRGVLVLGGASKLFSYFLKSFASSGQKILSYSDIAKTKGSLYEELGFNLDHISKPNYVWWRKGSEVKSRYSCQMKDEEKTMHEQGYKRIFDSGNKVWLYEVK